MRLHPAILGFVCAIASTMCSAQAQVQEDTAYTVYIPPEMTLRALRPDQSRVHPETPANVTFNNSLWWARTTSTTGSTIRLATSTPFVNVTNPGFERDVQLHSPRLFGSASANWTYDTATDQTDYAAGDDDAAVQISGTGPGMALIFLRVTFITGDLATLGGGDYEVTVVGTITAN